MRILLLGGHGRTGSVVAEVAVERGHSVRVLGEEENRDASALTSPLLAAIDVVIDFTTPDAAVHNLRACLSTGARVVVGTTGWYQHLPEMKAMAERKGAALLYGSNFSVGVQVLFSVADLLARSAPGYELSIEETHHTGKKDSPSGTALTLKRILETASPHSHIEIAAHRVQDVAGVHTITARSASDVITLRHEASSRRGFAEGAVRGAEWLSTRTGCYDFHDVFTEVFAA